MHANVGPRRRVQASYRFEHSQETHRIHIAPFTSEKELEKYCIRLGF